METRIFRIANYLSQYEEFVNTLSYFALINLNVILILFLAFLLFRNIVRLVVERRRGVLGSKLKAKLVVSLVFFALAPSLLLVYVSTQFITQRFVGWFSDQVTETITLTREAGAAVYKQDQKRISSLARIALRGVKIIQPDGVFYRGHPRVEVDGLENFAKEYSIHSVRIYRLGSELIWGSDTEHRGIIPFKYDDFVEKVVDLFLSDSDQLTTSEVIGRGDQDVVKGAAPIFDPIFNNLIGIVVVEERFESQLLVRLEKILEDFGRLRPEAQLIRITYTSVMIVMLLLIVFSAIWLGFYVAKGITGPLQTLADATREVALGNYGVSLRVKTDDETGQLVQAFNRMTTDLERHENLTKDAQFKLEKSNEELSEKSRHLEVVLKNISAGVISLDLDGKIDAVNDAALKLLMIDSVSVYGKLPKDCFSRDFYEVFWLPIEARLASSHYFKGHVDLTDIGRDLVLIVRATRILDRDGVSIGGVVVFDDAQDEVRAQKAAAWKDVARKIAHEIKNPITPIKLNAQRIQRRYGKMLTGEDEKVFDSCIQAILSQVDHLRDLVNNFASFSKEPEANVRLGNFNDLVAELYNFYRSGYDKITWGIDLDSSLPEFEFDPEQLRRVFVNLFGNAVEAIEQEMNAEGGQLSSRNIKGGQDVLAEKNADQEKNGEKRGRVSNKGQRLAVRDDAASNWSAGEYTIGIRTEYLEPLALVRTEIFDTGPGIPDDLKGKILEPYISTKTQGTGLGLAIVNQIVADHGGYIRIMDNVPRGSKFVFEIPVRK